MNFSNLCFAEHFVVWKVYKMLCKTYWVSITGDQFHTIPYSTTCTIQTALGYAKKTGALQTFQRQLGWIPQRPNLTPENNKNWPSSWLHIGALPRSWSLVFELRSLWVPLPCRVCPFFAPAQGLEGFRGLGAGKRQAWTPITSHWCGLGMPVGWVLRVARVLSVLGF